MLYKGSTCQPMAAGVRRPGRAACRRGCSGARSRICTGIPRHPAPSRPAPGLACAARHTTPVARRPHPGTSGPASIIRLPDTADRTTETMGGQARTGSARARRRSSGLINANDGESVTIMVGSHTTSDAEEVIIRTLSDETEPQGLAHGVTSYNVVDPQSGEQRAVFDLAWPRGLQETLSRPVVVQFDRTPARPGLPAK